MLRFIRTYWVAISLLTLVSITILSLWPLAYLPDIPSSDKINHLIAYAALMFPAALRRPRYWLWIGLFFLGWSGAIELLQPYANRYGEWLDLLANLLGLVCGMLIAESINRLMSVKLKKV